MDIQELLGIEIVDEKEQQKRFLRERVRHSVTHSLVSCLNFPTVPDIPTLSSQSIHDLASELAIEVKRKNQKYMSDGHHPQASSKGVSEGVSKGVSEGVSKGVSKGVSECVSEGVSSEEEEALELAKSHIKLNFLRFLNNNHMKCQDLRKKKTIEQKHQKGNQNQNHNKRGQEIEIEENNRKIKRTTKASASTSTSRSFGLSNTVLFKQPSATARNAGGISIHDKDNFNQSIDQLMEEALLDSGDIGDIGDCGDSGVASSMPVSIPPMENTSLTSASSNNVSISSKTLLTQREAITSSVPAAHTTSTVVSKTSGRTSVSRISSHVGDGLQATIKRRPRVIENGKNDSNNSSSVDIGPDESFVECPLCLETFIVNASNVDAYMDKHVERCLRRQQDQEDRKDEGRSRRGRQVGRGRYDEVESEDDYEADQVVVRDGTKRKTPSRSVRGRAKNPHVVKSDDSDGDSVSNDGGFDDNDDDYNEEDAAAEEEEGEEEEEEFLEESADVLDEISVDERPRKMAASSRTSRRGKVKSEDIVVVDDWEEHQYSSRIWDHHQEIQLSVMELDDNVNQVEIVDEIHQDVEEGEVTEKIEVTMGKHQRQFGEVAPMTLAHSAEPNAADRAYQAAGVVLTEFGSAVDKKSWDSLYPYQKRGVEWFWRHYTMDGSGGILGDEMGLGKSAQLCVHFSSIARFENSTQLQKRQQIFQRSKNRRNPHLPPLVYPLMLVVCPATVLQHWLDEFHHWAPHLRVVLLHSISESYSELQQLGGEGIYRALNKIAKSRPAAGFLDEENGSTVNFDANVDAHSGVVCITTYEGLRRLSRKVVHRIRWSAVCLDEGQKIRNPEAEITDVCKRLPCAHRLILSGTPIQNSLKELWSLFDFVFPGRLGTLFSFETEFSTPIRLGGYSSANKLQAEIAVRTATTLQQIIRPFLLRRRKEDVQHSVNLPAKTEQVLFCVLSPTQRAMYEEIIQSPEVERCIRRNYPAFGPIMALRKLCNHPMLTHETNKTLKSKAKLKKQAANASTETITAAPSFDEVSNGDDEKIDWSLSGKLLVLGKILPLWHREGHKVLIFCQMHSMLNLVEKMLRDLGVIYLRMDGHTPVQKRQGIIRDFNNIPDIFVLLLTSRTGGVGISLTAANRVILVDPDFNPQTDIQARERAWRIGQKREVTIYRLITKGTIEEKIYQRQIFKVLLSNRILDNPTQKRFFSKSELGELFELDGAEGGAYGNNNRYVTEHPPTSDLPDSAAIDFSEGPQVGGNHSHCNSEQPQIESRGRDSKAAEEEAKGGTRDKRLLKALFNGEALTAVYDHDYFEGGGSGSSSGNGGRRGSQRDAHEEKRLRDLAKKAVDDAVRQLELSTTNGHHSNVRTSGSSSEGVPKRGLGLGLGSSKKSSIPFLNRDKNNNDGIFSSISGVGAGGSDIQNGSSSSSVLTNLRSMQGRRSSSANRTAESSVQRTNNLDPSSILARLKRIFESSPGERKRYLTTDQVLENFGDLPDEFAHIFREMLRRVAVFKNGKWKSAD